MAAYCVDFQSGSDWYAPAADSEGMPIQANYCGRQWVVIQTYEFNSLVTASQGSSGSTVQPSFPLASLTLEQAEQLGWMSLAPIVAAYLARKFRDVLN